jgi:hypothetical protein
MRWLAGSPRAARSVVDAAVPAWPRTAAGAAPTWPRGRPPGCGRWPRRCRRCRHPAARRTAYRPRRLPASVPAARRAGLGTAAERRRWSRRHRPPSRSRTGVCRVLDVRRDQKVPEPIVLFHASVRERAAEPGGGFRQQRRRGCGGLAAGGGRIAAGGLGDQRGQAIGEQAGDDAWGDRVHGVLVLSIRCGCLSLVACTAVYSWSSNPNSRSASSPTSLCGSSDRALVSASLACSVCPA